MTPDDPRHGSYRGSQAHIRAKIPMCAPCHQAHLRYRRRRRLDEAIGNRPRLVPSTQVIEHLQDMREAGVTVADIASQAGVSYSMVDELFNRPRKVIRSDNAAALLGTRAKPSAGGQVPAVGTIRRIRALGNVGWSLRQVAAASGVKFQTLLNINSHEPARVTVPTAHGVAEAFETLCMTEPPQGRTASQVRTRAHQKGWPGPLAWDNIDDPDESPSGVGYRTIDKTRDAAEYDEVRVQRILDGDRTLNPTAAERTEIVTRWTGPYSELKALVGKPERYAYRAGGAA